MANSSILLLPRVEQPAATDMSAGTEEPSGLSDNAQDPPTSQQATMSEDAESPSPKVETDTEVNGDVNGDRGEADDGGVEVEVDHVPVKKKKKKSSRSKSKRGLVSIDY